MNTVNRRDALSYVSYPEALSIQRASWHGQLDRECAKRWFLFSPPPTITSGRRALDSDILFDDDKLARTGISRLAVDRGGLVTYHGPGQIVGFPLGAVSNHVGDTRAVREFFCRLQNSLKEVIASERFFTDSKLETSLSGGGAGIWEVTSTGEKRKLVSMGVRFHREGMTHGFALNVYPHFLTPGLRGFDTIVACGNTNAQPGFLFERALTNDDLERLAFRLKRSLEK